MHVSARTWLKSYLPNHQQTVSLNNELPSSCKYFLGCPSRIGSWSNTFFAAYSKDINIMMSPIVINMPTRALLATETKGSFVWWLANLNIKRNLTSMFVLPLHDFQSCSD